MSAIHLLASKMNTATLVITIVVPLLLGGFFNFYGNKPWILYFPLLGTLLALGYVECRLIKYAQLYSPFWIWISCPLFVVSLLVVGLVGHRYIRSLVKCQVKPVNATSEQLAISQSHELKELDDFIGGKEESELWELFDLNGITRFNIRRAKATIHPDALTQGEAAEINNFFKDGQAMLNSNYCQVIRTAGGFRTEPIVGKFGILNLSKKYVAGRQRLAKFRSSPRMPVSIQKAIERFDQAIVENAEVLLDVINENLAENPGNILHEEDGSSSLFGATCGAFLKKCIRLKPKQEEIMSAIRLHLGTQ
jgi:hypothetical protein